MSFYEDNEPKEEFYNKMDSKLFSVEAPIGRLKFFIYQIFIILLFWGSAFLLSILGPVGLLLVMLLIGYVEFVVSSSRLWDITGDRSKAIKLGIIFAVISFIFKGIGSLITLILLFFPGKLIK